MYYWAGVLLGNDVGGGVDEGWTKFNFCGIM